MFNRSDFIDPLIRQMEAQKKAWAEHEHKLEKARTARGRRISENELVELLVDVKQLGGERVPDSTRIVQRLVDAPGQDPAIPKVTAALVEQALAEQIADGGRRYSSHEIRKLIRAFRLRDLDSEHILAGDRSRRAPLHLCRRPRSKRRWWKPSLTLCGQRAGKFDVAERGEWAENEYQRCPGCERKDWSRMLECFEQSEEAEFDDPTDIDRDALEIASEQLQQAIVEIRAGVAGKNDRWRHEFSDFRGNDEYLLGEILEDSWTRAARRELLRQIVERGDKALCDLVLEKERAWRDETQPRRFGFRRHDNRGGYWDERIPSLYEQLPVGVECLVDLLDPDALYNCEPSNLLMQINDVLVEREQADDETFEQRQRRKRLSTEDTEREKLRAEARRQALAQSRERPAES